MHQSHENIGSRIKSNTMDYKNKPENYFNNNRSEMLRYLPEFAKTIIGIGCGDGSFGKLVKEKTGAEYWGIEYMPDEAEKASVVLDKVFRGPCEEYIGKLPDGYFDAVYCNDVLEHLVDPYIVLEMIKPKLKPEGVIISSIPNVRHYKSFFKVLFKKEWNYTASGVMDKTHLRFFTGKSIREMYEDLNYQIIKHEGINISRSIRPIIYNIPFLFTHLDIRYLQFATVARLEN